MDAAVLAGMASASSAPELVAEYGGRLHGLAGP
jgi:hypothetical protein